MSSGVAQGKLHEVCNSFAAAEVVLRLLFPSVLFFFHTDHSGVLVLGTKQNQCVSTLSLSPQTQHVHISDALLTLHIQDVPLPPLQEVLSIKPSLSIITKHRAARERESCAIKCYE